jgi:hypothetical protein
LHDSVKYGVRYDAPVPNPELAGTNGLVHHNVLWNLPKAMMIKGDSHNIFNNTSFNISGVDLIILDEVYPDPPGGSSNTSTIIRNNLAGKISGHRQNPQTPPGTEDHNVYSDTSSSYNSSALLTDPENKNFTPNSSAVELIDAGVIITGITDGYSGSAPDIGAYEVGDSWTAGATWTPNFYPWSFSYLQTLSGFVVNPSFEDGSAAVMVKDVPLDDWTLAGGNTADEGVSASIQTTNVHAGDGSSALEVTNGASVGEWNIKINSTTYPFNGNNTDPIKVTVAFWAKTTDANPVSNPNGDLKLIVRDAVTAIDRSTRAILTTNTWVYINKTFNVFPAAANYSLSLSFQFGRLVGDTQIDGITTSVTGGASLATEDIVKDDSSVFIYPNPAMNVLNYKAEGVKNIEVYNLLGQKLKAEKAVGSVNTSTFPKGSYILKLIRENGAVSTKIFVKE